MGIRVGTISPESLRPGGVIVFEHVIDKPEKPFPKVVHALQPNALRTHFADFLIEYYDESKRLGFLTDYAKRARLGLLNSLIGFPIIQPKGAEFKEGARSKDEEERFYSGGRDWGFGFKPAASGLKSVKSGE